MDLNKYNYAAHYCLAQIHYLNGNINAVDEALTRVLSNPRYKDCYEALVLLAKVKTMQGQRYEAMALYKRLIEKIYPKSLIDLHPSSFQVAQLFDQVDQGLALKHYEQGLNAMEMGIEAKFKEAEDEKKKTDLILEDEDEVESDVAVDVQVYGSVFVPVIDHVAAGPLTRTTTSTHSPI